MTCRAQDVLVIGLGYVGLPLAVEAARAGFRVTGYDTRAEIAGGLMAGRSHVDDVSDADVAGVLGRGSGSTAEEARDRAAGRDRHLRADAAVGGRRPGPERGPGGGARLRGRLLRPGSWSRWNRRPIPAPPRRWSGRCWRRCPG